MRKTKIEVNTATRRRTGKIQWEIPGTTRAMIEMAMPLSRLPVYSEPAPRKAYIPRPKKTHCRRGHLRSPENLYRGKECLTCHELGKKKKARRAKKRNKEKLLLKRGYPLFRIYLLTNSVTQKSYVGLTSDRLGDRWSGHKATANGRPKYKAPISLAIQKYGPDAFDRRVLSEALNEEVALKLECFWIRELRTKVPNGYNVTDGGKGAAGTKQSEATRLKKTGQKRSPLTRRRMRRARRRWLATRTVHTTYP